MDVALLTTDTAHHAYFAAKLAERFAISTIVVERRIAVAPFETFHPFEAEREGFERDVLLAGVERRLEAIAPVHEAESANHALDHLRAVSPDVVLVFGTGRLAPETIELAPICLNLHGGNPEEYRGLDSHLWAIYHRDFDGLVTTLHHVDAGLDTGDVVDIVPVPISRDMHLYELRSSNTEVCVQIVLDAFERIDSTGSAPSRPQACRGRYYSFMPGVLKDRCVREFERYTATL